MRLWHEERHRGEVAIQSLTGKVLVNFYPSDVNVQAMAKLTSVTAVLTYSNYSNSNIEVENANAASADDVDVKSNDITNDSTTNTTPTTTTIPTTAILLQL
eukprot:scaffold90451_cov24-Prasinocladus_malaysianus.AAC.2